MNKPLYRMPFVKELEKIRLPKIIRVRINFCDFQSLDNEKEIHCRLKYFGIEKLHGKRVAITASSRGGLDNQRIIKAIVNELKLAKASPFILAAMGSHGGATAAGQIALLAKNGVSSETMNAPVIADMETVKIRTMSGAIAHMNKIAFDADATIVVGYVKPHASVYYEIGSGLCKMVVVGLGNQKGARAAHQNGLWESVRKIGPYLASNTNIFLGVAVVTGGNGHVHSIDVVSPQEFYETDVRLLPIAEEVTTKLPYDFLDILVVYEMGKNISGTGMDPNVIGSWRVYGSGHRIPDYNQIAVLNLTDESCGNYLGLGQADFTTKKLLKKARRTPTYKNFLTSISGGRSIEINIPPVLENDYQAIKAALYASKSRDESAIAYIKNTSNLNEFYISEALFKNSKTKDLEIIGELADFKFNASGNLIWEN